MNKIEKIVVNSQLDKLKFVSPNLDNGPDLVHYLAAHEDNKPFNADEALMLSKQLATDLKDLECLRQDCIRLLEALLEN